MAFAQLIRHEKDSNNFAMYLQTENDAVLPTLVARRKWATGGVTYYIATSQSNIQNKWLLAKLKSNFSGSRFSLHRKYQQIDSLTDSLGEIQYTSKNLKHKGPRSLAVNFASTEISSQGSKDTKTRRSSHRTTNVVLENKKPLWDAARNTHVLSFHGRAREASKKNFQLVRADIASEEQAPILLFGKYDAFTFNMDFRFPLTPLLAFAIGLSSFEGSIIEAM